jgi:hypothetical protein
MQDQIVSWKHKYANNKENNENEIADLDKKYEHKLTYDAAIVFKKEENYKRTLEEHDNMIWKLKQEGDLHLKQIYELNNELKFRVENIKDAEEQ